MATQRDTATGRGFKIGQFAGIPIYASTSWLLIASVLVVVYAPLVERRMPDLAVTHTYLLAAGFVALLFGSVLAHELGHALVARRLGVRVRGMTLWALGGFTEMVDEPRSPAREFAIAVAGPAVSLALGAVGVAGFFAVPLETIPSELLWQLGASNIVLAIFNLLPGLPLDGGSLVRAVVWRVTGSRDTGSIAAGWSGRVIAAVVLIAGIAAIGAGRTVFGVVFTAVVAIFLWMAAGSAIRLGRIGRAARMLRLSDITVPSITVDGSTPLSVALTEAERYGRPAIITVDAQGQPHGVVSAAAVHATPIQRRPWLTVAELSQRVTPAMVVPATTSGEEFLAILRERPAPRYVVTHNDEPIGIVETALAIARLEQRR